MSMPRILCFGEVLWDCLPRGLFLGGAPLNVAAHLARLGARAGIVSSVGEDFLGNEAVERAVALGVDTRFVHVEAGLPTGTVRAVLDASGSASYTFGDSVAWDYVPLLDGLEAAVAEVDALVFGTLALRNRHNRDTLDRLLAAERPLKVCDVNLRPPHYDVQRTLKLARRCDLLKCNDAEAQELTGCPSSDPAELLEALASATETPRICITLGANGAIYRGPGGTVSAPAPQVTVRDTVGAGDAFMAALLLGVLAGQETHPDFLPRCCRLGAFVASQDGAVPAYEAARFAILGA